MELLTKEQIRTYLSTLEHWTQEGNKITKSFQTKGFSRGVEFIQAITPKANEINHHPDVKLTYPKVTFELTTHDVGGLTELDFQMAEIINQFAANLDIPDTA